MTNWTDIQDKVTGYRKYSGGDTLTTQDGRAFLTQDGKELTKQGRESAFVDGEDSDTIWVTGLTEGFNRYKNLSLQMNLLYILASADLITSPVQKLLDFYQQFGSRDVKAGIVHNALNFDLYPEGEFVPKDKKRGEIRIGWQVVS